MRLPICAAPYPKPYPRAQDSYLILDTLPAEYDSRVKAMEVDEKPSEDYSDIGGLDKQIQELVEAIVLPVTHKARCAAPAAQLLGPPRGTTYQVTVNLSVSYWLQSELPVTCPLRRGAQSAHA